MEGRTKAVGPGKRILFTCVRCDVCCGTGPNVVLTVFDVVRLAKRLNVNPRALIEVLANVVVTDILPYVSLAGDRWGRCVFLGFDRDGKTYCRVYDARPMRCRLYPAVPEGLLTFRLDEKCPGLGNGEDQEIVPEELFELMRREVSEHYKIVLDLVLRKGLPPLEALFEAIKMVHESEKKCQNGRA